MSTQTPILEVDGIVKKYEGHLAVDRVSFRVMPARIFGLLGPNGAGKTTTIRMVMDIIAPDAGRILYAGRPRDDDTNARIAYLPEERGLYRRMTVHDHLLFLADIRGLSRADAVATVDGWIERVDLGTWRDRKIEELSKGMQQKVQFVGAVLNDPPLWILDEPFSGLDPINTNLLKTFMTEARDRGTAIIFSTHVLEQAEKLCDDILLIKGGHGILDGSLADVRERFRTRSFLVRGAGLERLSELPMVASVSPVGERVRVELTVRDGDEEAVRREFLREAVGRVDITAFAPEEPDLESIFLRAVKGSDA